MIKEKVFQLFITGTGKNLDYFQSNGLGGVIFFTPDIPSKDKFVQLVRNIEAKSAGHPPLFLSIDQEGGRVERTENIHPRYLSAKDAFSKGAEFLSSQTNSIVDELIEYGLNMNFAPCLDVNSNPNNPIIGDRAFSDKPEEVCSGYDIVSKIYIGKGIIPVIKHFPGHGDADKDSHKELPQIDIPMDIMEKIHISPFKYAIAQGAPAVMVAHLHCTCFDNEVLPTSLSKNCINYLKNTLGFKGLIVSDDMYMKGLSKYSMTEACVMGLKSGINVFIYRDASDETLGVIEDIIKLAKTDKEIRDIVEASYNHIIEFKRKYLKSC